MIYQRLGIATVATVSWTVDQVARRLIPQDVASVWTDPSGAVNVVEYPIPDTFCGRSVMELTEPDHYRPIIVTRGGVARLAAPDVVGQEGDVVHFAVRREAMDRLNARLAADAAGKPDKAGQERVPASGAGSRA